jgi:hypothetical protein
MLLSPLGEGWYQVLFEFNIDVRFVASFVMRYRLSVIDCLYGHHIHLGLDLHRHRYRQLFHQTITSPPSPPNPQIAKLGETKKKNATVWPIPALAIITHLISFFFALILNRTRWTKMPGWLVGGVSYNKSV